LTRLATDPARVSPRAWSVCVSVSVSVSVSECGCEWVRVCVGV